MEIARWQQRFFDLKKAFSKLQEAVNKEGELDELEKDGVIQRFEFTFELVWKTLQDYFGQQGFENIATPKKILKKAYETGIIKNEESWIEMLGDRNKMSHIYNQTESENIFENIKDKYVQEIEVIIMIPSAPTIDLTF